MNTQQKEKTAADAQTGTQNAEALNELPRAERDHVAAASGDIVDSQLGKLQRLFPEVFVEGKIDFDKLRATLGAAAESGPGRFHFSWGSSQRLPDIAR